MARRRNHDFDIVTGVAQVAMLLVLAYLFIPQVRQLLLGIGLIAFGLVVFVGIVALIIFLVSRSSQHDQNRLDFMTGSDTAVDDNCHGKGPSLPQIAGDLVIQLRTIDWFQFEKIVAVAYRKLGYSVTRRGGANPDGGIDLLIIKNGETKAVQCKQWKTWNVGVKAVREFLGALTDAKVQRGIFVTLGGYTGEAKQLADKHGIKMLNETELARMLESADAKYDPEILALLRDQRKFCPKCESEMVLRTAKKGLGAGNKFWGCSSYPRCRFTMPV